MNQSFKIFTSMLLGAMAIVGCQREPVNPDFHPDTNEVTAQLILNVSAGQATKMSAVNVQGDAQQPFLGIDNVKIVSFDSGRNSAPYYISSSALQGNKMFTLGEVYGTGGITGANNASEQSNRILELNIPVGTDVMLFYGKAINNAPGKLTGWQDGHVDLDPSKTYFKLKSRMGDASNEGPYFKTAQLMAFILNRIFSTSIDADEQEGLPALSWAALGDQYEQNEGLHGKAKLPTPVEIGGLGEILAAFYANMMYIPATEYRAGSAVAVQNMINDLYAVLAKVQGATSTDEKEQNAQRLATAIKDRTDNYFTTGQGGGYVFKTRSEIKSKLNELNVKTTAAFEAEFGTGADNPADFPYTSFGVPEGAAQLTHPHINDDPNQDLDLTRLAYRIPNRALLNTASIVDFSPTHYTYPAELTYYGHSPLRVTETQNSTTNPIFPNGTAAWASDGSWSGNGWVKNGSVGTATRSVALVDNINYGVAMLKTSVAFAENVEEFHDNRAAISTAQGGNDSDRIIPKASLKLKLTGILVGGQNNMMNWQFLKRGIDLTSIVKPEGLTEEQWNALSADEKAAQLATYKNDIDYDYNKFNYVVYDDAIASSSVPTTTPNYTLLFDNYDASAGTQPPVNVALEFINEGDDFWGKDNLIRKGGKFYLLAELKPTADVENGYNVTDDITWPTDHQIPPLYGVDGEAIPDGKTAGQSKQIKRIFIQDFVTQVTFRLGPTSLQKAYVSVPDLRSSQFSLGLSVDIAWTNGYTFDILIK